MIAWLLKVLRRKRYDITRRGKPYLTRWALYGDRYGPGPKLYLHLFHASDYDAALHDHPWSYWSLILCGGYWEHSETGRRWYGMGRLLRRPAEWKHRVELPAGKRCWTLFWVGDRVREWGFRCPQGWLHWKTFADREEAGKSGCEE